MAIKKIICLILFILICGLFTPDPAYSTGPLDPVRLGTRTVSAGIGPGTHYFGNGAGFGPAFKGAFEAGMWDAGPGILTLGGEATLSFFNNHYGEGWNESWGNIILGGRGTFHYGWDVEGFDSYGGIPLGIGFCAHSSDYQPGNLGSTPVYPYIGIFFGASYFFTKSIGINGEFGYSSTYLNIGVIFKLK